MAGPLPQFRVSFARPSRGRDRRRAIVWMPRSPSAPLEAMSVAALGQRSHVAPAALAAVEAGGEGLRSRVLVVHLSRVEIHESARRHGVADGDIEHALVHSITWAELGDDPPRYLLAGPDRAGNLLELVVLVLRGSELVIDAMGLRRSTAHEIFGDE